MLRIEDCKPGVMVECINDGQIQHNVRWDGVLRRGAIYTIRWGGISDHPVQGLYFGVRLHEIVREDSDRPFCASRFRLLPDSRLEVFRAMLAPQPADREAELLRAIEGVDR